MPAIPLLSRGFSSSTSSGASSSGSRGSGTSSTGSRGSYTSSSSGLLPGALLVSATTESKNSASGDSKVAIYTVIGLFAVVGFCTVVFAVCRCTRPCRRARKAPRATTTKETPARQATNRFLADREYLQRIERARQAIEAALIIQMSFPVREPTRYNRGHHSVRPIELSTMGSSAEVQVTRPEPALHRTSSTNATNPGSRPTTPLPKYARYDPLRKVRETAEFDSEEESPSYTARNSPSPDVERGSH